MRFRETLWFKKKPVEEDEVTVANQIRAGEDTTNLLRPVEDRYSDEEAPVSREDSQIFGLHTGRTSHIPRLDVVKATATIGLHEVSEQVLAAELKRLRVGYGVAAIAVLVVTVVAMLVFV